MGASTVLWLEQPIGLALARALGQASPRAERLAAVSFRIK